MHIFCTNEAGLYLSYFYWGCGSEIRRHLRDDVVERRVEIVKINKCTNSRKSS